MTATGYSLVQFNTSDSSFKGYDKLLSHTVGQRFKGGNRRAAGAVFNSADIGLADTGFLRQFFLGQILIDPRVDQGAHDLKFRTGALIEYSGAAEPHMPDAH